ncbi:hypothetical protein SAMN06297251_1278 [Fulvimarina manganoxydans]|uniref:Bacteriophage holin of superfamily 6 (Holin_LLH) n=1 Tax=Fulvimarina manganoxydans TaxID=937218 RepID=A0A1W2EJL0_9HYPH|nr:hypothetical protein [Fulvimarina manganoxydans]SMD09929.1 hypothetical protein SAMN06297251_1278 [Fulvimarina manganoxydans]
MEQVLDALLPLLATILTGIAIPALVAWLRANNVVKDEAQARLLQSALANAAETALARVGGRSGDPSLSMAAREAALDYVKQSVPGTVRKLGLEDRDIVDLIMPHLSRAATGKTPPRPDGSAQ